MSFLVIKQRISGDRCVCQHCFDTNKVFTKRENHVIGVEGAVYKTLHRPGAITIHNDQVYGKYMATIWSIVFMYLILC